MAGAAGTRTGRKSDAQLNAEALARREAQYVREHFERNAERARVPRTFAELLSWFLSGWAAETPEQIHSAGVWRARPARIDAAGQAVEDVPAAQIGGSLLGSPREAEPFRQLLENSPRQTSSDDVDEHYVRPMRAALARMAGSKAVGQPSAFMSRFLTQVALNGGEWRVVALRWNIFPMQDCEPPECDRSGHRHRWDHTVAEIFALEALRRLQRAWQAEPPARVIPRPAA